MINSSPNPARRIARRLVLSAGVAVLAISGGALAQDLQSKLDDTKMQLDRKKEAKGVLVSELDDYNSQINQLAGDIATLRNREAIVAEELRETQSRLVSERENLDLLRSRLGRSLNALSNRLVEIYKADQPDALTVILEADGFDDLVNRYDYLDRIQDQDAQIVSRVHNLRDASQEAVTQIRSARDSIRLKREKLERTRANLEAREAELDAVRDEKAVVLQGVEKNIEDLEGDLSDISAEIEERLREQASTTTSDPQPAGPGLPSSATGDFIYPTEGVFTSPFGFRWGRLHAGIDIGAPGGTPIWATKDGVVTLAEYYGGYGNYTCVDHGGGVSSCYAHQSAYNTSVGAQVKQGEVIGYVGTTGSSTGDHLHFEIRINGTPVDPLGYVG